MFDFLALPILYVISLLSKNSNNEPKIFEMF